MSFSEKGQIGLRARSFVTPGDLASGHSLAETLFLLRTGLLAVSPLTTHMVYLVLFTVLTKFNERNTLPTQERPNEYFVGDTKSSCHQHVVRVAKSFWHAFLRHAVGRILGKRLSQLKWRQVLHMLEMLFFRHLLSALRFLLILFDILSPFASTLFGLRLFS